MQHSIDIGFQGSETATVDWLRILRFSNCNTQSVEPLVGRKLRYRHIRHKPVEYGKPVKSYFKTFHRNEHSSASKFNLYNTQAVLCGILVLLSFQHQTINYSPEIRRAIFMRICLHNIKYLHKVKCFMYIWIKVNLQIAVGRFKAIYVLSCFDSWYSCSAKVQKFSFYFIHRTILIDINCFRFFLLYEV